MGAITCGLIFLALTLAVEESLLTGADRHTELLVHAGVSRELYGLMAALTFVGDSGSIAVLAFVCVVFYLRTGEYWAAAFIAASPTGASMLDLVLKSVFQRARPHLWSYATIIHSYSFPSGHATISSAFFAGVSYVTWKLYGARTVAPISAVCALITVGIGFSRVYLGVHWPSDVLAGFALGLGWALLLIVAVESWRVHAGTALAATIRPPRKASREHRYSKM
jgi:membrane-associated phospholipid phosphatase